MDYERIADKEIRRQLRDRIQPARRTLVVLVLAVFLITQGCASTSAEYAPDSSLSLDDVDSLHVQKLGTDERGVEVIIADELTKMGFDATHGKAANPPHEIDALVTYQDHWWWDITMYMTRLHIQIRNPESHEMIAEGEAFRPSLQRQPPEQVARAVLDEIFTQRQ